jgi:hypothetical protein
VTESEAPSSARRLKSIVALLSVATIGMGLWLGWTSAIMLPRVDRTQAAMWLAVAGGFVGFSGLCSAYLRAQPPANGLRAVVMLASLAAVGFGVYAIREAFAPSGPDRPFENALVVIGLVIAAHGACALAYARARGRDAIAR